MSSISIGGHNYGAAPAGDRASATVGMPGPGSPAPEPSGPVVDGPVVDAPVPDAPVPDAPVPDAPVPDVAVLDAPVLDAVGKLHAAIDAVPEALADPDAALRDVNAIVAAMQSDPPDTAAVLAGARRLLDRVTAAGVFVTAADGLRRALPPPP